MIQYKTVVYCTRRGETVCKSPHGKGNIFLLPQPRLCFLNCWFVCSSVHKMFRINFHDISELGRVVTKNNRLHFVGDLATFAIAPHDLEQIESESKTENREGARDRGFNVN